MSIVVTTPQNFKANIRRLVKKDIPDWQAKTHKKIHLQVANGMIKRTPVGNPELWQIPAAPPVLRRREEKSTTGGRLRWCSLTSVRDLPLPTSSRTALCERLETPEYSPGLISVRGDLRFSEVRLGGGPHG